MISAGSSATPSWWSDLQGELGQGFNLMVALIAGSHEISLHSFGVQRDRISITAVPVASSGLIIHRVTRMEGAVSLAGRIVGIGAFSADSDGAARELRLYGAAGSRRPSSGTALALTDLVRDRRIPLGAGVRKTANDVRDEARGLGVRFSPITPDGLATGAIRAFWVADPRAGNASEGFNVEARLSVVAKGYAVWVDTNAVPDGPSMDRLLWLLDGLVVPRCLELWGAAPDTDGDGRIAILLSPILNESGVAIGFFNPNDLFPLITDPDSPAYNPLSNQGEVLYIACPLGDANTDFFYGPDSIAATVGHEMQHLIHFGVKTLMPLSLGNEEAPEEESFLDEGLSHLTESLIGLGVSGGNVLFASFYLENTALWSLTGVNASGSTDGPGKRGAVAMLLWYVYWRAGGALLNPDDPLRLEDRGGIAFLRSLHNGGKTGIAALEESAGSGFLTLLEE